MADTRPARVWYGGTMAFLIAHGWYYGLTAMMNRVTAILAQV